MISPDIRKTIMECAHEFDVKAVWIFGSSLEDDSVARDIDFLQLHSNYSCVKHVQ